MRKVLYFHVVEIIYVSVNSNNVIKYERPFRTYLVYYLYQSFCLRRGQESKEEKYSMVARVEDCLLEYLGRDFISDWLHFGNLDSLSFKKHLI